MAVEAVEAVEPDLADAAALASPTLLVDLRVTGSRCILRLTGALDESSIAALEAQIDQLGCTPCQDVVVDVTQLTDIDAVGANLLSCLGYYVEGRGGRLTLVGASQTIVEAVNGFRRTGEATA